MPKDYLKCREALQRDGKSLKEAQRICAIQYYKKHGKPLPREASSGLDAEQLLLAEINPIDDDNEAIVLNWFWEEINAARDRKKKEKKYNEET